MKSMCPLHSLPHTPVTRSLLFFFFTNKRPLFRFYTATSPWKRPTRSQPLTTFNICHPLSLPLLFFPPDVCVCLSIWSTMNDVEAGAPIPTDAREKKSLFFILFLIFICVFLFCGSLSAVAARWCSSLRQSSSTKRMKKTKTRREDVKRKREQARHLGRAIIKQKKRSHRLSREKSIREEKEK